MKIPIRGDNGVQNGKEIKYIRGRNKGEIRDRHLGEQRCPKLVLKNPRKLPLNGPQLPAIKFD